MRLSNYLNEELDKNHNWGINAIKQDCSQFLNDIKKQSRLDLLFSGRNARGPFIKREVRKNRKPLDTPIEIQATIDEIFRKHYGVRPRSNSIFCYVDDLKTKSYGTSFVIFPTGNYKLLGSPEVNDLYDKISQSGWRFFISYLRNPLTKMVGAGLEDREERFGSYEEFKNYVESDLVNKHFREFIEPIIKSYQVIDASQLNRPTVANEIMVMSEGYYGILNRYYERHSERIWKDLEI